MVIPSRPPPAAGAPGIPHDIASMGSEEGLPQCYNGGFYSDPSFATGPDDDGPATYDRRIIRMAVVNCEANAPLSGNEDDVPVIGFVKMFLTQPAEGKGNDKADLWGEVAGVQRPGTSPQATLATARMPAISPSLRLIRRTPVSSRVTATKIVSAMAIGIPSRRRAFRNPNHTGQ